MRRLVVQRAIVGEHLLVQKVRGNATLATLPHLNTTGPAHAHALHGISQALAIHRRRHKTRHAKVVARGAFEQLAAAAHLGRHAGTARCKRLQHAERLALGDARQNGKVKLFHVLNHVDAAGKDQVAHAQGIDQRVTLGAVLLVIHATHDVQAHAGQALVQLKEGIDHGLDVLDGRQAHHRANVHPAVIGL